MKVSCHLCFAIPWRTSWISLYYVLSMGAAHAVIKHERTFDAIRWHRHTPLSKFILYSLYVFKNLKSSSTWFIPPSLCEGPFFYFHVESSPCNFMHQLRENSCHSEYNVHSPKIYYWLIHDYGIACSQINLITIWTLKVSWHLYFAIPQRTSWIPLYYVLSMLETNV